MEPYQKHGIAVLGSELEADVDGFTQTTARVSESSGEVNRYRYGIEQDLSIVLPIFRLGK